MNSYKELREILDTLDKCLSPANYQHSYVPFHQNVPMTKPQIHALRELLYAECIYEELAASQKNPIAVHYQDGEI